MQEISKKWSIHVSNNIAMRQFAWIGFRPCCSHYASDRNLVGHLISAGQNDNALLQCATVLDELGEGLPNDHGNITEAHILREYVSLVAKASFAFLNGCCSKKTMIHTYHCVLP